jgi:hypothetical protein
VELSGSDGRPFGDPPARANERLRFRGWSCCVGRSGILWRRFRHPLPELFKEMHVEGRAPHLGNLPGIDAVESDSGTATERPVAWTPRNASRCVPVSVKCAAIHGASTTRRRNPTDSQGTRVRRLATRRRTHQVRGRCRRSPRRAQRTRQGPRPVLVAARVVAAIERRGLVVGHAAKGCIAGSTPALGRRRSARHHAMGLVWLPCSGGAPIHTPARSPWPTHRSPLGTCYLPCIAAAAREHGRVDDCRVPTVPDRNRASCPWSAPGTMGPISLCMGRSGRSPGTEAALSREGERASGYAQRVVKSRIMYMETRWPDNRTKSGRIGRRRVLEERSNALPRREVVHRPGDG